MSEFVVQWAELTRLLTKQGVLGDLGEKEEKHIIKMKRSFNSNKCKVVYLRPENPAIMNMI